MNEEAARPEREEIAMEESEKSAELDCPFLKPVVADWIWMYPTAAYCRPPSGRVRVPAPDTLARLCTSGHYHDCPGYRQRRLLEIDVTGWLR
jgi:hypothetical protein